MRLQALFFKLVPMLALAQSGCDNLPNLIRDRGARLVSTDPRSLDYSGPKADLRALCEAGLTKDEYLDSLPLKVRRILERDPEKLNLWKKISVCWDFMCRVQVSLDENERQRILLDWSKTFEDELRANQEYDYFMTLNSEGRMQIVSKYYKSMMHEFDPPASGDFA